MLCFLSCVLLALACPSGISAPRGLSWCFCRFSGAGRHWLSHSSWKHCCSASFRPVCRCSDTISPSSPSSSYLIRHRNGYCLVTFSCKRSLIFFQKLSLAMLFMWLRERPFTNLNLSLCNLITRLMNVSSPHSKQKNSEQT